MLNNEDQRKLPKELRIRNTEWYGTVRAGIESYKRRLILFSLLVSALLPLFFIAYDRYSGFPFSPLSLCAPLVSALMFLLFMRTRRFSSVKAVCVMAAAWIGFFAASFAPGSNQAGFFILMTFVPLAFHLNGSRKGVVWSLLFLSTAAIAYLLIVNGLLPDWNLSMGKSQMYMLAFSIVAVFVILYSGQYQDEKMLAELVRGLVYDRTTGLPNKESLLNSLPVKSRYMLAIVKIENFGELSSLFGYEVAEQILKFAAQTLGCICERDGYKCYKLLGYEFGIVIPLSPFTSGENESHRILDLIWFELQSIKMTDGGGGICLSYRIGASINSDELSAGALSKADIALNTAQKHLHNVYIYDEKHDPREAFVTASRLYGILLDNVRNDTLKTVYQPVVHTRNGEVKWYEALLRVKSSAGVYDSVYPYLAVARNTGLYNELSRFILREVKQKILTTGADISVNITLSDIMHPGFEEDVIGLCRDIEGSGGRLILEIVESEELVEIDICRRFIEKIKELGCRIAIDDFGSGYSNFCNLLNLPVDIVKIDGMLMRSAEKDANAVSMVESIASFCHKSGKQIVAEYIENEKLRDFASRLGIQYSQGYFFGKPGEVTCRVTVEAVTAAQ